MRARAFAEGKTGLRAQETIRLRQRQSVGLTTRVGLRSRAKSPGLTRAELPEGSPQGCRVGDLPVPKRGRIGRGGGSPGGPDLNRPLLNDGAAKRGEARAPRARSAKSPRLLLQALARGPTIRGEYLLRDPLRRECGEEPGRARGAYPSE